MNNFLNDYYEEKNKLKDSFDIEKIIEYLSSFNNDDKIKGNKIIENYFSNFEEKFFINYDKINIQLEDYKNDTYLFENIPILKKNYFLFPLENYFKIIHFKEKHNFNQNEEELLIKNLIKEIKYCQQKIYNSHKKINIYIAKKHIQLYLFIIYITLKNYPFYILNHEILENYFNELSPYKNWPDAVGNIGYLIYKLFINDLYLPGTKILYEIRKKYMLDIIDPNKFLLIKDDFIRYFFIYDNNYEYKNILKDNNKINAIDFFSSNKIEDLCKLKNIEYKSESKFLKDFKYLTIIHLIIFCGIQFMSYSKKLSMIKLKKIYDFYCKAIPEYKTKEGLNIELLTKSQLDQKSEKIKNIFDKNLLRNTCNKSLLNSFFNIIDEGLNTDYFKDFLPLIKGIKKKTEENINNNNISNKEKFKLINLRKYLKPKIDFRIKNEKISFLNLYKDYYLNLEDKYFRHLTDKIKYENFNISKQDKYRVDIFNNIVKVKNKIIFNFIQLKLIYSENEIIDFFKILLKDIEELKNQSNKKILFQQQEEKDKNNEKDIEINISHNKPFKSNINKSNEKNINNKKEEFNENNYTYSELLNIKKNHPHKLKLEKLKIKKEFDALPNLDIFLNSITLYILPDINNNILTNYMNKNDFIYYFLIGKLIENNLKEIDKNIIKDNIFFYFTEAKYYFYLNIYEIKLFIENDNINNINENLNNELENNFVIEYFYTFLDIKIIDKKNFTLKIFNEPDDEKEYEIIKYNNDEMSNILINNISPKKDYIEVKYLCDDNSENLDIFILKTDKLKNDIKKYNIHEIKLSISSICDIFKTNKLELTGDFIINNLGDNFLNKRIKKILIEPVYYLNSNNEKIIFKPKIASFSKF